MNRKIAWDSGALDEIELVYGKAEENADIGKMMEALELAALVEAKANLGLLTTKSGQQLSPEDFVGLSDVDKETVIRILGQLGLASLDTDIPNGQIRVELSTKIQKMMGCTIFNLLNRLEKLDGAINILRPKWTLVLQVPLGGRKGLFQWEMLIMQLYPWISVSEVPTNAIAE